MGPKGKPGKKGATGGKVRTCLLKLRAYNSRKLILKFLCAQFLARCVACLICTKITGSIVKLQ